MKKTKQIISLALSMILILSLLFCLPIGASAANNNVYSDTIACDKGDEIEIPVMINNNTGIMGFKIILTYDSNSLTPISVSKGEAIKNGMVNDTIGTGQSGSVSVVWSGTSEITNDGTLFTVKFKVSESAKDSVVKISYSQDDTFNESWQDVTLNCSDITININNENIDDDESGDMVTEKNPYEELKERIETETGFTKFILKNILLPIYYVIYVLF